MTDQLTKLADLRDRGGISAEELERGKAKAKVLAASLGSHPRRRQRWKKADR